MPSHRTRACLAAIAALLLFAGCGGSSDGGGIPADVSDSLQSQIDDMQSQFDDGDCEGANSSLTSIRNAANASDAGIEKDTLDDINKLIDNLDEQLGDDCEPAEEKTTSTTTSTTTTESTTTDEETSTTDEEPPDTSTTEEPPPGGGETGGGDTGGNGTGGTGGIGGGG